MALKSGFDLDRLEIFTLDTHKLFKESLEYQKEVEKFFSIKIKTYAISGETLAQVDEKIGQWGMRDSVENRKFCCHQRKMIPLREALNEKEAWISGIRAAQSVTRTGVSLCETDANFNLKKINPLFDFSDEFMWGVARELNLPVNELYAKGYASIGCEPCTRAIKPGEDIRAGRWWWEDPNHKECGLHIKGRD
jgi:APS REDUCTASE